MEHHSSSRPAYLWQVSHKQAAVKYFSNCSTLGGKEQSTEENSSALPLLLMMLVSGDSPWPQAERDCLYLQGWHILMFIRESWQLLEKQKAALFNGRHLSVSKNMSFSFGNVIQGVE